MGRGHFVPLDLYLNILCKGPHDNATYQKVVKRKSFDFFMYFNAVNQGPSGARPFWTLGPLLEQT